MNDTEPMTETRTSRQVMLDQQLALGVYLQALLRPLSETAPGCVPESGPAADPVPVRAPEPVPEREADVIVETPPFAAAAAPAPSMEIPAAETLATPACIASPRPAWARDEFQCLLFRCAGLMLALPLVKLNGVLPWDAEAVTEMPNHQPWFLGLREHLGQKVKLIDVANVVLPPDRRASLTPADSGRLGKVILIDEGRWGLVCDDVDEVIILSIDAVKWRSQAGSRPWLAGTVIKQMCALIDTEAFAAMLGDGGPVRD